MSCLVPLKQTDIKYLSAQTVDFEINFLQSKILLNYRILSKVN